MAVQTQIQTRRGTAASWTSTNPTLAAGEIGYESDTGKFKIGTGSTAWASLTYFNPGAIASPLTTKGDLYTYSTADARLAVGANGETLVADSSASTGLRYQANFAAGKNKIINGDFRINQRAFSSTTSSLTYIYDRWQTATSGGTATYSAQTFTPGTAPVSGYEAQNFLRIVTSGQSGSTNFTGVQQKIEDVRTLAGQTATISFWAKASSGTPKISIVAEQSFGTGGSPSGITTTLLGEVTLSTSWARYSVTGLIPSISGKTIGTASDSALLIEFYVSVGSGLTAYGTQGLQANTFEMWGVQVENGSVATAFQTATGTLAGELAACQRYYTKSYDLATAPATATSNGSLGLAVGTNSAAANYFTLGVTPPVAMRTAPVITLYDLVGNSGKVTTVSATDLSLTDNVTGTADRIGEKAFRVYVAANARGGFYVHYVASAEL